jgi:hypothetical protein
MHVTEIKSSQKVDEFTKEKCKRLVEMDIEKLRNRNTYCSNADKLIHEKCIEIGQRFIDGLG